MRTLPVQHVLALVVLKAQKHPLGRASVPLQNMQRRLQLLPNPAEALRQARRAQGPVQVLQVQVLRFRERLQGVRRGTRKRQAHQRVRVQLRRVRLLDDHEEQHETPRGHARRRETVQVHDVRVSNRAVRRVKETHGF